MNRQIVFGVIPLSRREDKLIFFSNIHLVMDDDGGDANASKRLLACISSMEMMESTPFNTSHLSRSLLVQQSLPRMASAVDSAVNSAIDAVVKDRRTGSRIGRMKAKLRPHCTWIRDYLSTEAIFSNDDFRMTFGVSIAMFKYLSSP